ncbi:winged helix-turn-helix transcriptional regulator [Crossiella sp. SN42]|uniref:winged helix-turn-helix transcriptional regulator n=1 Tax=Crossiella sp. SN42 TaxID=2944808 RepID=UPI0035AB863D
MTEIDWTAVQRVAHVVRGEWTLAIVRALMNGPLLYSRLKSEIENGPLMSGCMLHHSTLSRNLANLVQCDVLERRQLSGGYQPSVEYRLTDFGKRVVRVLREAGQ